MLVSFTQTYGNDRTQLYEIYSKDEKLIEFKNLFDTNIHSFHNCHPKTIEKYKKFNKVKNTKYLYFNNIKYPLIIRKLRGELFKLRCTHFFFSQDDTFSDNNNWIDWKEFLDYVKLYSENLMISLRWYPEYFRGDLKPLEINETFKIYEKTSFDFYSIGGFSMDDSPYICTMDLFDKIYNDEYMKLDNIWEAELYLMEKFSKENIPRFITDKSLFKCYNIIGRTLGNKSRSIQELKRKKLL